MDNKPAGKSAKCHAHDQAITSRRGVRRLKPYSFMLAPESVRAARCGDWVPIGALLD
jgi:hypothetical protein